MVIWLAMAGLTVAVVAALVWPLTRPPPAVAPRAHFDAAVYRDRLAELERDLARGAIGPSEAEAARNEVSRRILGTLSGGERKTENETSLPWRSIASTALVVPL